MLFRSSLALSSPLTTKFPVTFTVKLLADKSKVPELKVKLLQVRFDPSVKEVEGLTIVVPNTSVPPVRVRVWVVPLKVMVPVLVRFPAAVIPEWVQFPEQVILKPAQFNATLLLMVKFPLVVIFPCKDLVAMVAVLPFEITRL